MDRRRFVAGAGSTIVAGTAQASVAVDRFGPSASMKSGALALAPAARDRSMGDAARVLPVSTPAPSRDWSIATGTPVQSHINPGEGHGLSLASWPDAIARTQAFLLEHL